MSAKDEHVVGVISDTHGLLRPEAVAALRGSELIIHAGDIGGAHVIPALRKIAPVVAVHGNVDYGDLLRFPATNVAQIAEHSFYVLHNLQALDLKPESAAFSSVISGHSHKPMFYFESGVLYMNPGSAGPHRFSLPVTVGKIVIRGGELFPEIIELI